MPFSCPAVYSIALLLLQSSTRDFNLDGVADELHISARMPLQSDEVVMGASLTAFLDVKLSVSPPSCDYDTAPP